MPVMLSYNLTGHQGINNTHIQSMLERFGWENVGGSSYRYPPLDDRSTPRPEDWFNHVVPALMLFRAYVLKQGLTVSHFSLDASVSTGFNGRHGAVPQDDPGLAQPNNGAFGEKNLRDWLSAATAAVPY